MRLHAIDLAIIGAYLLSTVFIGLYLKRRAGQNLRAYFQGGRKLPWYMLGPVERLRHVRYIRHDVAGDARVLSTA